MNASSNLGTGAMRSSSRTFIILILTIAMFAVSAVAPAMATSGGGEGGDDIAAVRAEVTGTYNYKIGLLTDKMSGTENADKKAVYAAGISELASLRDSRVATEDSIDELWALNQRAHDIYNTTKARANEAGEAPGEKLEKARNEARDAVEYKTGLLNKWKGCEAKLATDQITNGVAQLRALYPKIDRAETSDAAYSLKDQAYSTYHSTVDKAEGACEGKDPRSNEEIAADRLKSARSSALAVIEHRTAILTAAAAAARNPVVKAIFAAAAEEAAALEDQARGVKSVEDLKNLEERAMEIYHTARDAVAELRGDDEADDQDDAVRSIESHLGKTGDYVNHLTEIASQTAGEGPETYEAVVAANGKVHDAIDSVMDVAESGKGLHARWQELARALKSFKRAFVAHYVSISDAPACYGGLQIPG